MENITKNLSEDNEVISGFGFYYFLFYCICQSLTILRLLFSPKIRNIFGIFLILPATTPLIRAIFLDAPQFDDISFLIIKIITFLCMTTPLIFNVFSTLMTLAEYKRRYFLRYFKEKWYVIIIAMLLHILATVSNIVKKSKFLSIFVKIWVSYVYILSLIVIIIEFIFLKRLQKKYRAEAENDNDDESQPLNNYVDINRNEKNLIFQFSFVYIIFFVSSELILEICQLISGENISTIEYVIATVFDLIMHFILDILLISYVDERINISILF
ncbi:hypothetical protein PVAND_015939 [Polypedilum vanderplanki]|uniref:Uncharacterized protein n=1 Tax=Polypedilum vanderplanki TaxID=319348 RepID=A0A9J6BE17_POLVA|nr:hypothetical protein PVAND_015939 [Polypedilum vanderplanki]